TQLEVVEMDHPSTQKRKIESAQRMIAPELFEKIRFVPLDLDQKDQLKKESLIGEPKKTVFVLEGLTGYLSQNAIDLLFQWMRSQSLPGSRVIFTYVDQSFVEGKDTSPGAWRIFSYLEKSSEPFVFGWKPESLPEYCKSQGFQLLETISSARCVDRYLKPLGRKLHGADFFHLAIAEKLEGRDGDQAAD
ncbi:MAG: class I SAM-dependent methyltransferase, partial [Bdellovibrionia bacterium]